MSKEQTDLLFGIGDLVETAKGAKFWGEIIAFDSDKANPGCTVRAVDGSGFDGTKHVYPMKQLRRRASPSPAGGVQAADVGQLRKALQGLIDHVTINECRHENTHRGGLIWTICDDCGRKWADDRGGFHPYEEPPALVAAMAALSSQAQTTGGVE